MPSIRNDQTRYADNLLNRINQGPVKESSGITYSQKMEQTRTEDVRRSMREAAVSADRHRSMILKVKETLLGECYNKIYTGSLLKIMESANFPIEPTKYVTSYIKESGVDTILRDIRYKSKLLSEVHQLVEKYTDKVLEACKDDKDCINFKIPSDIRDDFYDELDMTDTDDVVFSISDRVNDAIDEFVNTNTMNKLNIKQILQSTSEKISNTKSEISQESAERVVGRYVHDIKNNGYIGIFSSVVEGTAKSIMGNEVLRESYMEDTTLNMSKIVDICKMSYTFMEMANILNLERINESYLLSYIKSL